MGDGKSGPGDRVEVTDGAGAAEAALEGVSWGELQRLILCTREAARANAARIARLRGRLQGLNWRTLDSVGPEGLAIEIVNGEECVTLAPEFVRCMVRQWADAGILDGLQLGPRTTTFAVQTETAAGFADGQARREALRMVKPTSAADANADADPDVELLVRVLIEVNAAKQTPVYFNGSRVFSFTQLVDRIESANGGGLTPTYRCGKTEYPMRRFTDPVMNQLRTWAGTYPGEPKSKANPADLFAEKRS